MLQTLLTQKWWPSKKITLLFLITILTIGEHKTKLQAAEKQIQPKQMNAGTLYNVKVPPRKQDAYENAHYRLWIPNGVKTIRAIIVRQHGCGPGARKFGLEHANDLQWQALARKHNCALMGSQIWAPKEVCSTWYLPADGSEYAFLAAIEKFSVMAEHPELAKAPWCLWGHSGGAIWVMNMLYRHPEKTVAVFPRSGGLVPSGGNFPISQPPKPNSCPAAYRVPVMFCYGELENQPGKRFYGAVSSTHAVYDAARVAGAVWAVAEHPKCSHENQNSRLLAIHFFDAMIEQRISKTSMKLVNVQNENGWLGNLKTGKIQTIAKHKGDPSKHAWLPGRKMAEAWKELVTTGTIKDKTPPLKPHSVTAKIKQKLIAIHWSAEADIESGIAQFRIYRNGKQIGTVGGHENKRWNPKSYFQAWNYSDQPIFDNHPLPEMKFVDNAPLSKENARYEVTTVNQAGLESKKTALNRFNQ